MTYSCQYSTAQNIYCCPEKARISLSSKQNQSLDQIQWLLRRLLSGSIVLSFVLHGHIKGYFPFQAMHYLSILVE